MYALKVSESLDKKLKKLKKKNKMQLILINKKIPEIKENPYHFKPLRNEMKLIRRVHIDAHFVLTFTIDEINKEVKLLDFDHHDNIYHK